ncbi:MAG: Ig-like domain-containing protein, partial [Limisphaerales bacterium]
MKVPPGKANFELESLEPRVLLSGDGLVAAAPGMQATSHLVASAIELRQHESFVDQHAGAESSSTPSEIQNVFEGVVATSLESPEAPLASGPAEQGASANERSSQSETATRNLPASPFNTTGDAVTASAAVTGSDSSSITQQLVETLHAANGPPATDPVSTPSVQASSGSDVPSALVSNGPTAVSDSINGGKAQRSLVTSLSVTFSTDVSSSLAAADLVLHNITTGSNIASSALAETYNSTTNTATWTFPGLSNKALPEGNYLLEIRAATVTDVNGTPLASDFTDDFHVLTGDVNGDRVINDLDLYRVWQNQLKAPSARDLNADLNGDGQVDAGDVAVVKGKYLAKLGPSATFVVTDFTPSSGSTDVGVTVRPQVFFSKPVDPFTLNSDNFYATAGGQKLLTTIVPSNDGRFAWLFFAGSMPNASEVQVTVDGATIRQQGTETPLDANGDGVPGGTLTFSFTTVSLTPVAGTSLSGIVVDPGPDLIPRTDDDVLAGPTGYTFLHPIAGVKVYLIGLENQAQVTGADGKFHFDSVPVGDVKVAIDGLTATNPPASYYFPEMVIDSTMTVGIDNQVMQGDQVGQEIYLARLKSSILNPVSNSTTTTITANADAAPNLSPADRQFLSISLAPNSLIGADGQKLGTGSVGISTVPPDLVTDMLPPGVLQHTFDITVQAPGISTFSTPAPMTFPNVFNSPPGTKLNFLSFDHTTGRLVIEGTATVSADGLSVTTDPGTGVTHPGWHGLTPPGTKTKPPCDPGIPRDITVDPIPVTAGLGDYYFKDDNGTFTLSFGNAAQPIDPSKDPCNPENDRATPLIVVVTVEGQANDFLIGLSSQTFSLEPGEQQSIQVTVKQLLTQDNIVTALANRLYGVKVHIAAFKGDVEGNAAGDPLINQDLYVYRFFDIADNNHTDGQVDFEKTFVDGIGGVFQEQNLDLRMPASAMPTFSLQSTGSVFGVDYEWRGGIIRFDPLSTGARTDSLQLTAPDGNNNGSIQLQGKGIEAQRVLFSETDFTNTIKKLVDARPVIANISDFVNLFPADSNGNGLRSDEAGFQGVVDGLYTSVVAKIQSTFSQVTPAAQQALDIVNSDVGTGILLSFTLGSSITGTSIGYGSGNTGSTGGSVDIGTRAHVDITLSTGNIDAGTTVNVFFEQSADNATWSSLATFTATRSNDPNGLGRANQTFTYTYNNTSRYIRVRTTQTGGGSATYGATVTGYDNPCGSPGTPACAYWADFDKNQFLNTFLPQYSTTSSLQDQLRFDSITNVSYSDDAAGRSQAVQENLDILASYVQGGANKFTTLLANAISHEVGHDLGAIHLRDNANNYVVGNGDVMGSGGSDKAALHTFVTFAPLVKFALGLPVTHADFQAIWDYYKTYEPLETYRHNTALPSPGDTGTDLVVNVPILSLYDGPLVRGGSVPNPVASHDFGSTIADGLGGVASTFDLYLFNNGGQNLAISDIHLLGPFAGFSVQGVSTLPIILSALDPTNPQPALSMTKITLKFDPTVTGPAADVLRIDSNTFGGVPSEVPLSGLGISPFGDIRVTVANNNFGGSKVGVPSPVNGFASIQNLGASPLSITNILSSPEYVVSGLPIGFGPSNPLTIAPGQTYSLNVAFSPNGVGLRRADIQILSNDPDTQVYHLHVTGTGLPVTGTALQYGSDFVALETPDLANSPVLRAVSDDKGNWSFFLPPNQPYHYVIFDPISGLVAHGYGVSKPSGQDTPITAPVFKASTAPDTDGDGLPDDAEFAIGTSSTKADTDGDGIDDFTAIQQGLDPLGGRSFPTGVIASLALQGEAKAVVVAGSANDAQGQTAFVATGTYGLAIVDVTKFSKPVLSGQIQLSGDSSDVAVDLSRNLAVVANSSGLDFVDITDLMNPVLTKTVNLPLGAESVRIFDGVAYATSNTSLVSIDLASGEIIQTLNLGGQSLTGIAREGSMLYTMDAGKTLRAVDISDFNMAAKGSLLMPDGGGELFVGNGIAYIAAVSNFRGGFATANVSDPNNLTLIAGSQVGQTSVAPGTAIVSNGSGLGIVIGSPSRTNSHVLDLMNVADPTNTTAFLTGFNLPADPAAVTLAQGIAFVADGTAGLQVVNYLSFDNKGQAPAVSISSPVVDVDPNTAGFQLVEGSAIPVKVNVTDDVQVRNVELLVNGSVVANDVSFPFDFVANAPKLTATVTTVSIQVLATDTGGNTTLSNLLTYGLVKDNLPPAIVGTNPTANQKIFFTPSIDVLFSKALDKTVLSPSGVTLTYLGADGVVGGGDDVVMALSSVQTRNLDRKLSIFPATTLNTGNYQLTLDPSIISDRVGNHLASAFSLPFTIRAASDVQALVGTPAVPRAPSANVRQEIGFYIPGATIATSLTFPTVDSGGNVGTRAVKASRIDAASSTAFFIVPDDATTGNITLPNDSNGAFILQIVPTLIGLQASVNNSYHGSNLRLRGSGFVAGGVTINFGNQALASTSTSNPQVGYFYAMPNDGISLTVPNGVPFGPISVTTSGGTSQSFVLTLSKIVSTTTSGTPADATQASANPGQAITLQGNGFDSTTNVVFPVIDGSGKIGDRVIQPVMVDATGTQLTVLVPVDAVTGNIGIVGDRNNAQVLLQVIPIISNVDFSSVAGDGSSAQVRLRGAGFVKGNNSVYTFGAVSVTDTITPATSITVSYVYSQPNDGVNLTLPLTGNVYGPVTVQTAGGTSAPFTVGFSGVNNITGTSLSVALSGTPTDATVASANPGQAVTLVGSGLSVNTAVVMQYIDGS